MEVRTKPTGQGYIFKSNTVEESCKMRRSFENILSVICTGRHLILSLLSFVSITCTLVRRSDNIYLPLYNIYHIDTVLIILQTLHATL